MDAVESPSLCVIAHVQALIQADLQPGGEMERLGLKAFVLDEVELAAERPSGCLWVEPDDDFEGEGATYQMTPVRARVSFHGEGPDSSKLRPFNVRAQELLVKAYSVNEYGTILTCVRGPEYRPPVENIKNRLYCAIGRFYTFTVLAGRVD